MSSNKKRVRAQTGGQTEKSPWQVLGISEAEWRARGKGGGAQGGPIDLGATPEDVFFVNPEELEFPLKGFVKDPQTKKNIDLQRFRKSYPGITLPGDPDYKKGKYKFQRQPTGPPKLLSIEEIAAMLAAGQPMMGRKGGRASSRSRMDAVLGFLDSLKQEIMSRSGDIRFELPAPSKPTIVRGAKGGKVEKVMGEFKRGTLHSGSKKGPKVTSREQAIAIAMSEARRSGRAHAARGGTTAATPRGRAPGAPGVSATSNTQALIPLQQRRIDEIQADTSGITNIVDTLKGFQPGGAGQVDALGNFVPGGGASISQLQQFEPLRGQARTTQDELLGSGLETDVSALTEAAKIRAGQEFDTAQDKLGERYAALGLGSSSAAQAAVARERAKLGERIAATGLEAGVQAKESAAGRRAGAIGAELGASGQRLGATEAALSGELSQSGQRLQGLESAGQLDLGRSGQRLGALGTALGGATSASELGLRAAEGRAGAGQGLINPLLGAHGQERGMDIAPQGPMGAPRQQQSVLPGSFTFARGAKGGRADYGDFLSDMLFGRTFTRRTPAGGPTPASGRVRQPMPERSSSARASDDALAFQRQKEMASYLSNLERRGAANKRSDILKLAETLGGRITNRLGGEGAGRPGVATDFGLTALRGNAGVFGLSDAVGHADFGGPNYFDLLRRIPASTGEVAPQRQGADFGGLRTAMARQRGAGGGVPQPPLPEEHGIQVPGLLDPRRRFYDEGGGVAPGTDDGADKIPALLRSEELVLTPELADAVVEADPEIPQPELIRQLQELAMQPLEFSGEEGEFVAQEGGRSGGGGGGGFGSPEFFGGPTSTDFYDLGRIDLGALQELLTRIGRASGIPGLMGRRGPVIPRIPARILRPEFPLDEDVLREDISAGPRDPFAISEGIPGTPAAAVREPGSVSMTRLAGPSPRRPVRPTDLTQAGDAGFGTITPQPGRQGSFSVMSSTLPSAQPLSPEEKLQRRLDDATRRRDLISAAVSTDPTGSPEKQARMLGALDNAERQVNAVTNEVIAREQQRILAKQTEVQGVEAQANLAESAANILRSKAQQQTAEAELAKTLLEASTTDPVVANIVNALSKMGNTKDERQLAIQEAVFGKILESRGVQIKENGWLRRLFGAPQFELQPMQPEVGAAVVPSQDTLNTLLSSARQPIAPEQFQFLRRFDTSGVQ